MEISELIEKLKNNQVNYQQLAPSLLEHPNGMLFRRDEVTQLFQTSVYKDLPFPKGKVNNQNVCLIQWQGKEIISRSSSRGTSWELIVPGDTLEYGKEVLTYYSAKWLQDLTLFLIDSIKLHKTHNLPTKTTKKPF